MRRGNPSSGQKQWPLIAVIGAIFVVGILAAGSGFAFAASQETHDSFCASCHTQPESTFYQQSTATQPVDLAAFHRPQNTRCIDCHSGQGVTGRISAELIGARNALKWYTGTAVQPAVLIYPIGDQNCLKCHQDVTQRDFFPKEAISLGVSVGNEGEREGGRPNHWHEFLGRWQAASPTAGSCVSCHTAHLTDGTAQTGFMNTESVGGQCQACHQVLRREEGG